MSSTIFIFSSANSARDRDKTELAEYERVYRAILELAPGFEQSLESFYEDKPEALQELLREVWFLCRSYSDLILHCRSIRHAGQSPAMTDAGSKRGPLCSS